jgi:hypothetical protein
MSKKNQNMSQQNYKVIGKQLLKIAHTLSADEFNPIKSLLMRLN